MRNTTLIQGVTVKSYRSERNDLYRDGTWSGWHKCDILAIEIDPVIHEEGLTLDKQELKDFIRLLKKTFRQAKLNDITSDEEN